VLLCVSLCFFVDQTAANCCVDPSSTSYGHCQSATAHNCPGISVDFSCNAGANTNGADGNGNVEDNCPSFAVNKAGKTIFPRSQNTQT